MNIKTLLPCSAAAAIALAGMVVAPNGPLAHAAEDFYRGKTITMIVSTGAGGGVDANARVVARYLGRHIPGDPAIVVENMPGAGHVIAANYTFNVAPRDGTAIETTLPAIISHQLLDGRGVHYDIGKFGWLGSNDVSNQNVYVWATSGIKTFADARARQVTMGATGAGSYTLLYPRLMNALLGTKFKIVSGYRAAQQIDLALQTGEVQGRAGDYFSTLEAVHPDWLRDKKIRFIAQIGLVKDADHAAVPMLTDFATTNEARRVLRLFATEAAAGHPFLTPPGVPAERLAVLRKAFEETMQDPAYLADARKIGIQSTFVSAAKLRDMVNEVARTPPPIIVIAREIKDGAEVPRPGKP